MDIDGDQKNRHSIDRYLIERRRRLGIAAVIAPGFIGIILLLLVIFEQRNFLWFFKNKY